MKPEPMKFQTPLYSAADIRRQEQACAGQPLMELAGRAIANYAQGLLPDVQSSILLLAGPGNNGGDAFVAARLLRDIYRVALVFCGDTDKLPADAAAACRRWQESGGELLSDIPAGEWDLVIDGLFGIGLGKPLSGRPAELVAQVNRLGSKVLAIDIPSGLCADSGKVMGAAIHADCTMTFLGLKPGLFTLDGPDHAGTVVLEMLGTAPLQTPAGYLLEQEDVSCWLQPRRKNSNKGSYGSVGVVGGARQMSGAAILAARAALLLGSGRVYAGLLAPDAPAFDMMMPELMLRQAADVAALAALDCVVIGPGMGVEEAGAALLADALGNPATLVLDADALNLLAGANPLKERCAARKGVTIVTPHPGEAARMLAVSVEDVQQDRIAAAQNIAQAYGAITVLKGCGTVIAMPDGRWWINHSGNPGLASAGMGDALAGMIAAFVAQGLGAEQAALLGVHLHGAAADALVSQGLGPVGLTASEVLMEARHLLNHWLEWSKC